MEYKCEIIGYAPKIAAMAQAIEAKSNEMARDGYELISCSISPAQKAVLVFKRETKAE